MFGLSFGEIFVIGVIALIFIGPEELPVIARTIARFLNDLKNSASGLTDELKKQASIDLEPKKMGEQIFDLAASAVLAKKSQNQETTEPQSQTNVSSQVNLGSDLPKSEVSSNMNNNDETCHQVADLNSMTESKDLPTSDEQPEQEFRIVAEPFAVPIKPRSTTSTTTTILDSNRAEASVDATKESVGLNNTLMNQVDQKGTSRNE